MGANLKTSIKKDLSICLKTECERCSYSQRETDSDCPYAMLHILSLYPIAGEVHEAGRRSGKTKKLVSLVNQLYKKRQWRLQVHYVTMNREMASLVRKRKSGLPFETMVFGQNEFSRMKGRPDSYFVTDEVSPEKAEEIAKKFQWRLIGGYWTP